jgi:cytosine/adenosine deaminase-related metal-dependent hydrolase
MILRSVEMLGTPGIRDVVIRNTDLPQIAFDGALAFPGLVNSHDHLEFNCYRQLGAGRYRDYLEWGAAIHGQFEAEIAAVEAIPRRLRVRMGTVKNLLCGVTSVAHHGPPTDAAEAPVHVISGTRAIHSPRLGRLRGMLVPDRRMVVSHVGEGVNEESAREIDELILWNIWRKKMVGVHAIAMRADQARRFTAVVWCPVSNGFLFGRTAPVAALKQYTTILFGTDSTLTAPWNLWDHVRHARQDGGLTDEELIAALTTSAARVWNLKDVAADLVVARKRHPDQREAFFAVNPEDILMVVKAGRIVLLDASLKGQLPAGVKLLPVAVNGVKKFTVENCFELVRAIRTFVRTISIPIR